MPRQGTRPTKNKTNYQSLPLVDASQKMAAEEGNYLIDKATAAGLNDTLTTAKKFDDVYYPDPQTISASEEWTIDETNAETGNGFVEIITASGAPVFTFTGFTIRKRLISTETGQTVTLEDGHEYTILSLKRGALYDLYVTDNGASTATTTPPTLSTITIENAAPTNVVMVFNEVVTGTNLGFTIAGTASTTFASISGSGTNTITGVLGTAAVNGETITLSYDSGTGDIQGTQAALASITSQAVTNNVGDITAPTITSMTVENAAPNDLVVTLSDSSTFTNIGYTFRVNSVARTLTSVSGSPGTVATFLISGAAIVSTDVLDLAYSSVTGDTTKVSNSVELVTFAATTVTNNVAAAVFTNDYAYNVAGRIKSSTRLTTIEFGNGVTESDFSLAFQIKATAELGNTYPLWYATDAARTSPAWQMMQIDSGHGTIPNRMRFYTFDDDGDSKYVTSTDAIAAASPSWGAMAITYNSTSKAFKIYIDGVEDATAANAELGTYDAQRACGSIHRLYLDLQQFDEFQIYDKELSSAEVAAIHPGSVVDPTDLATNSNLVDYRRFEQDLTDSSDSASAVLEKDYAGGDPWGTDAPST